MKKTILAGATVWDYPVRWSLNGGNPAGKLMHRVKTMIARLTKLLAMGLLLTPILAYSDSVMWSHNADQPPGAVGDHNNPWISSSTSIIASAQNETSSGLTQSPLYTYIVVNAATVPASTSGSHYFQYQFTTANTTDIISLTAVSMPTYIISKAQDTRDSGMYKLAVQLDDDPAFSSPLILFNPIQIDSQNPATGASFSDLHTGYTDFSLRWNRYDLATAISLDPDTTYTVRVYLYDVDRNAVLASPPYTNTVIYDDFGLILETSGTAKTCSANPRIVFILDDSGSIDDVERAQMSTALQSIADGLESEIADVEFGVVQLGTPPSGTPREGIYSTIMGYTKNPVFAITNDANMKQDHLPDSIAQMLADGLYSPGGELENPDAFFLFTDAAKHSTGGCCSVINNSGPDASTDAKPGYGTYADLAGLASTGVLSLYHVLDDVETPEVAQGGGIYRSGNSFVVSQQDIDDLVESLKCEPSTDQSDIPLSSTSYSNAIHTIAPGMQLGNSVTPESTAYDSQNADGDEDNGVTFPSLYQGQSADITVSISGASGYLQAWIDFNGNAAFENNEQVALNIQDGGANDTDGTANDSITAAVNIPSNATLSQTFARFRWSTTSNLNSTSTASNGEVEDYAITILQPPCTALSGQINSAVSPNPQLLNGDKIFLALNDLSPTEGHLKAYSVNANGLIASSTALWDAASEMNKSERTTRLYSTDASGNLILFKNLDDAAFASNGLPDASDIKSYTLEPSHESPQYLGNRREDSFLGAISPGSNIGIISDSMDTLSYLNDTAYRSFFTSVVSQRSDSSSASKRLLVSSDDGFLYAFNQHNGDLGWGWMPPSLVQELKNHFSFQNQHLMRGKLDVLDLKDAIGNYATYIIGSYKGGVGQYVLKLKSNSGLDSIVWDIDHSQLNALVDNAPNNGQRAYFSDGNGKVYSAYVTSTLGGDSTLHIRSLTDTSTQLDIVLDFTATSTPYVMTEFGMTGAPAGKTLYLGDANGNIHAAGLLNTGATNTGNLQSTSVIHSAINGNAVNALDTSDSSAVRYIGASSSASQGNYYLRAQSSDRLTVFKYQATNSSWIKLWTTYAGGAGKWVNGSTTLTADSNIQNLPAGATITDNATIVADSLVLPVEHAPTGNNCFGAAYYYLYALSDAHFPASTFSNTSSPSSGSSAAITTIISLGYGPARQLQLSDLPANDQLLGIGLADQKTDNSTGINATFTIQDPVTTGIRSWREIRK